MTCSQIWLSHLVDDHQSTYLTKIGRKKQKKTFSWSYIFRIKSQNHHLAWHFQFFNILPWIWRLQMWKQKWNSISCQLLPVFWESFCQFLKFLKSFCHIWTQNEKKRKEKGGTSFCRYLNHVELLLHSYRVVLQMLNIVWNLSLVLIDTMENKHGGKNCSTNSIVVS